MSFQNRSDQEMMSEINVTPLVDVMLVMLVVFIVTAPLLTQSISVTLPKTLAAGAPTSVSHHVISIAALGDISLNGSPVTEAELSSQLAAMARQDEKLEVQVDADSGVAYGKVAELMAIAQHAGVNKLSFVSIPLQQ